MTGPLLIGLITQFYGVHAGFITCGALALIFLSGLARYRTPSPGHLS